MPFLSMSAAGFGRWNRVGKLEFARAFIEEHRVGSVLLVGVGSDFSDHTNQVERGIEGTVPATVATGIVAGDRADWRTHVRADARALPFADRVLRPRVLDRGRRARRRRGGATSLRGRARTGGTVVDPHNAPNRLFPVEAHFHTLLRHSRRGWTRGDVTRLLSRRDLRGLVPDQARTVGTDLHPTLMAYRVGQ